MSRCAARHAEVKQRWELRWTELSEGLSQRRLGRLQESQLVRVANEPGLRRVIPVAQDNLAVVKFAKHDGFPPSVFRVVFLREDELADLDLISRRDECLIGRWRRVDLRRGVFLFLRRFLNVREKSASDGWHGRVAVFP